jgi:hypothetical protein
MVTPSMPDDPGRDYHGSDARPKKPRLLPLNPGHGRRIN